MNQRRRLPACSESMEARLVLSAVAFAPDSTASFGDSADTADNPNEDDQSTNRDVDNDSEGEQKRTSKRKRATGTRNDGRPSADQTPVTDSRPDSNRGSGTDTGSRANNNTDSNTDTAADSSSNPDVDSNSGSKTDSDSDSTPPKQTSGSVQNDDSSRTDTTDSSSTDDTSDRPSSNRTVSTSKDSDSTTPASDSTKTRVNSEPTEEKPPATQTSPTAGNDLSSGSQRKTDPIVIRKQQESSVATETDRKPADSPDGTRTRKIETQPTDQTKSEPDTEVKPRTETPTRREPTTETPHDSTTDSVDRDSKRDEAPTVKGERSITVIRKSDREDPEVKPDEGNRREPPVLRTTASVAVIAIRDRLDSDRSTAEEPTEVEKPTTESREDISATSEEPDDLEEESSDVPEGTVTNDERTAELPSESGPTAEPGPVDHPQHVQPDLQMPTDQHVDRQEIPVLDPTRTASVTTKYVQFLHESRTSVNSISLLEDDLNGTVFSQESVVAQNLFGDATRLGLMLAALNHSGRRSGALISFSDSDEQVRDEGTHYSKERRRRRSGLSRRAPTAFDRLRMSFSLSESVDERVAIPCAAPSCDSLFADAATMSVLFHEMEDDSGSAVGKGTLFGGLLAASTGIALSRASQSRKNRLRNRPVAATPRYNGETLVFAD